MSTSAVKVPGKLGSPWEYSRQTSDADRAFASLVRAVEETREVTVKTIDAKGHYMLAEFPSKVHIVGEGQGWLTNGRLPRARGDF